MTIGYHRIHREATECQEGKSLKIKIRICVLIICAFMKFIDITTDTKSIYRLKENERAVFFLFNRGGDITFDLRGDRSEAHIIALFDLGNDDLLESRITQIHRGADTRSSLSGRSILRDRASCDWQGLLSIRSSAVRSDAHQEMRHLLLSPETHASSLPSLEIEQNDVRCGHAATMSAPDQEQKYFLESRGLSPSQAEAIIAQGFIRSIVEHARSLTGEDTDAVEILQTYFPNI